MGCIRCAGGKALARFLIDGLEEGKWWAFVILITIGVILILFFISIAKMSFRH